MSGVGSNAVASGSSAASTASAADCPAWLSHTLPRLQDETPHALCQHAGKVLLVVNTASRCGYTPQYEGLVALHARFADRGFSVLAFPSNDFNQEYSDTARIADVCFNTFGVQFPIFTPVPVRGAQAHPVFAELAQRTGTPPAWNFHKYLVDRSGQSVLSFSSAVAPQDPRLISAIEALLTS